MSSSKYEQIVDPPPAYSVTDPHKNPNGQGAGHSHVNMMHHNYGATITDQPVTVPVTQVILIGGCPACRVGILEDSYSLLGIICAILFFPLGILCCLALKDKRCSNCGASF